MATVERKSVFARDDMYERIHVELSFEDRLVGGIPLDPDIIPAWIRKAMGVEDELELRELARTTIIELGQTPADVDFDGVREASETIATEKHMQGFKRDDGDPYIESRIIKAGIKECVNILFAKQKWGKTFKGPKNFTAERVFVKPDRIPVGSDADVKTDLFVGHHTGPKGPMSSLGYYEYVEQPVVEFEIVQLRTGYDAKDGVGEPSIDLDRWAQIWTHMELNGLGAMRSQGFGQFAVTRFEVDEG